MKPGIVIVCGPTATGKTECAVKIAEKFSGEVVNADSMQVYRGMDIGTAKPTPEEKSRVPFHLVDIVDPMETFSTGAFVKLARKAIADIHSRNMLPVVAGGTGLYLKALTQGIFEGPEADKVLRARLMAEEEKIPGILHDRLRMVDPEKAAALPPTDLGRIVRALEVYELTGKSLSKHQKEHSFSDYPYTEYWVGLNPDRDVLYERINQRVVRMINEGWLAEVEGLKQKGFDRYSAAGNALGYRTLMSHLDGGISIEDAIPKIQTETRKFAKRQLTWYRPLDHINWFVYPEDMERIFRSVKMITDGWKAEENDES